jgi:two-component system LytT family response regulator
MLNTLIVEDEVLNRDVLRSMIQKYCPDISILGEAESVASAIISIEKLKPELLFLDIELGDGSAFDLLRQVTNPSFNIIFTTAYDQYALRAIKFNALDYLLKPIDTDELKAAVNKATQIDPHNHQNLAHFIQNWSHPKSENPVITLSTSESFEYIPIRDIVRCEAQGAYTRFHLRDKQPLLVSKTLKEYEPLLQPFSFCRAHQSHLINLSEVVRYIKTDGGYIVLKDGARIGVARTRRDDFLEAMRNLIQV